MGVDSIACPDCAETEFLASVEALTGYAPIEVDSSIGEWEFGGPANVDWESSKTVGWRCGRCGWEIADSAWLSATTT